MHIATVGEGGKLNIEMRLKSGPRLRGGRPQLRRRPAARLHPDRLGPLAGSQGELLAWKRARLGQMTDYDKLTIEVWTNGAISPQDAIGQAAKLLKDHMTIFINFEELPEAGGRAGRARA